MPNAPARTKNSPRLEVREIGRVDSVKKFIVSAGNLPSAINGQVLEFEKGTKGLVMGFDEHRVQVLVLGPAEGIHSGNEIYNRGEAFTLPAGEAFLGRTVNALGQPVDPLGALAADVELPVFGDAPAVLDRQELTEALESGSLCLDAGIPIAKGQRQLLIGDRGTGKTTVALDAILNQKDKGTVCIYCCIGKPYASLLKTLSLLHEKKAMANTVVVSAVASTSAGEQYIAPYSAAVIGEYFMRKGRHVLVVFDDLTKHAWVYRQISLLLERSPGREAYPGDIFYVHSQLMERAGRLTPELGGGSMTFLPIVEVLQGDITGYIPTNIISMTDGQVYFSTPLFNKGFKPPVDFGLSVSRIGNKGQWPAMKEVSRNLRLEYLQHQELLQMTQLRSGGLSTESKARLRRGEALTLLLQQEKNKPISMVEQIFFLFALNKGALDLLPAKEIQRFKREFFAFAVKAKPSLIADIEKSGCLPDASKEGLTDLLKKYIEKAALT